MATRFAKGLGADPVDLIELEFALEEEFGIEIPDVDAEKPTTVGKRSTTSRALFEAGFGKGNGAGGAVQSFIRAVDGRRLFASAARCAHSLVPHHASYPAGLDRRLKFTR